MTCFDVADNCSELGTPSSTIFGHSRPIQRSCYSAETGQLVTASYDGLICRWDLATGCAEPFLGKEAHKTAINGIIISDDRVVTVGFDDRIVFASLSRKEYEYVGLCFSLFHELRSNITNFLQIWLLLFFYRKPAADKPAISPYSEQRILF